jgi:DNA-binding MarR family transcriptional regulator
MALVQYFHAMTEGNWYDEAPLTYMLRKARGAYADAVRDAMAAGGFEDLPRNGAYVLTGLLTTQLSLADLVEDLEVSKQAASLLIDTLVLRGYLERATDSEDRRRMIVSLTARGHATAEAVGEAITAVNDELERHISAQELAGLRAGLAALMETREHAHEH